MLKSQLIAKESQLGDTLALPDNADMMRSGLCFLAQLTAVDSGSDKVQTWIMEETVRILGAKSSTLYLCDEAKDERLIKKTLHEGGKLTSQLISLEAETLVEETISTGSLFVGRSDSGERLFYIPLTTEDRAIGTLVVESKTEALDVDMMFAIGRSIANSSLISRQVHQSQETIEALQTFQGQLLNSRNTLRALFDSSPTSIYIVNQEYTLIAINISRADLAESSPKELVGQQCFSALYQREAPCSGCLVGETLQKGTSTRRIERRLIADEYSIELEISTFPIWDQDGQVGQAFLFEEDVTERQQLQASLAQSEKLAVVGQLAAGVAHEINNPLTTILGNAQLLQRSLPPEDKDNQEMVALIIQASDRASQAVRDLLDFARRERYELTPTDLNETIQHTLALIKHELGSRSITLRFDPGVDLPAVNASQDHLQGVWLNLLINAIDAIDPGPGTIHITTSRVDDSIEISIADSGQGIPPENIARIFEPFYTTKEPGSGTGLGLSVCHQIVTRHGGKILVNSQPDEGTTFTVYLPIA